MKLMDKVWDAAQRATDRLVESRKGGVLPYGIAWLLGVPISILVIVYLIRGH